MMPLGTFPDSTAAIADSATAVPAAIAWSRRASIAWSENPVGEQVVCAFVVVSAVRNKKRKLHDGRNMILYVSGSEATIIRCM